MFSLVTMLASIPFVLVEIIRRPPDPAAIQVQHILAALETGVIGTSPFYLAHQKAIKLGDELTASLFTYLQPVSTIFFAVLLIGEEITIPFLAGGTLAILGAGLASLKGNAG